MNKMRSIEILPRVKLVLKFDEAKVSEQRSSPGKKLGFDFNTKKATKKSNQRVEAQRKHQRQSHDHSSLVSRISNVDL